MTTAATATTATGTATGIATAAATKKTNVTGIDNAVCYFLMENASRMEWHATILWPRCTAHAPNTSGAKPSPPPPLLLSAA